MENQTTVEFHVKSCTDPREETECVAWESVKEEVKSLGLHTKIRFIMQKYGKMYGWM